jgi:hypothetical protein
MIHRTRLVLAVLLSAGLPATALCQNTNLQSSSPQSVGRVELSALAGYQLNSDVHTSLGRLAFGDTEVYGVSVGMKTMPGLKAELLWLYSDPEVRASGSPTLNGSQPFHVGTNYFQVGGTRSVRRQAVEYYGRGTLGAALFQPGTIRLAGGGSLSLQDTWRFAFTLGGGLEAHLNRSLALTVGVNLAAPVYFTSGVFYAGSGGSGMAVSGGIPLWQWNFLGGLVFSP